MWIPIQHQCCTGIVCVNVIDNMNPDLMRKYANIINEAASAVIGPFKLTQTYDTGGINGIQR